MTNSAMLKKSYDLTEITRLLLEMRENCIPKAGNAYEDPNRAEKYDALNAAIDLINNPSLLTRWISVKDRVPEEGENRYLVRLEDGFIGTAVWDDGWELWNDSGEVTHWMCLPEPPKEE